MPGTGYRTRFGVLKSSIGDGIEVATLYCIVADDRVTVDRRLIRAVVDSCLAPALRNGEAESFSSWLSQQDYSREVYAVREFPRFNAELLSIVGRVYQVRVGSKGQTGPGAVPTTGAGSAG
ncbi:hypothetical protein [Micromonospora sp. KC213]|uniref:hypothetical protein n=1 Tax=Micromonospora sp. KC213 TaxID=2530378 RepID=UPI00105391EF|nr:hypothetical protein [Micromonospora sp. KC213]TDC41349.1 hypothetical protein E1166_11935 [Micromonospora sp. KC213]